MPWPPTPTPRRTKLSWGDRGALEEVVMGSSSRTCVGPGQRGDAIAGRQGGLPGGSVARAALVHRLPPARTRRAGAVTKAEQTMAGLPGRCQCPPGNGQPDPASVRRCPQPERCQLPRGHAVPLPKSRGCPRPPTLCSPQSPVTPGHPAPSPAQPLSPPCSCRHHQPPAREVLAEHLARGLPVPLWDSP